MNIEQAIDTVVRAGMQQQHIPGLSLALIDNGNLVMAKGYGFANLEWGVPATAETVYEIASLTKLFTATGIMMLVEDGKLNLDDPVTYYCQGLPEEWQAITLHHLLNHSSGVNSWSLNWWRADLSPAEVWQDAFRLPLQFAPGTQSDYCDVNYNILGMVIHQVTGKSFNEFLQDRLFLPLGMSATRHHDWRAIVPNRAAGYCWEADEWKNCEGIRWHPLSHTSKDTPANGANGSLLSSVSDFARWDAALHTEQIISRQALQQMRTPTVLTNGALNPFGYGWSIDRKQGLHYTAQTGMNPAFAAWFCRFFDANLSIALFINCCFGNQEWVEGSDPRPWEIGTQVAGVYNPILKREW